MTVVLTDDRKVQDAVAAWIRAEWHFRCGPVAYRGNTQEQFEKACTRLRRALTAKGDLAEAFERLETSHGNGKETP